MNKKLTISKKELEKVSKIRKRSGRIVDFDIDHVMRAVYKALKNSGEGDMEEALYTAKRVVKDILRLRKANGNQDEFIPSVEMVQNLVEEELMLEGFTKTAKAYILYRQSRLEQRKERGIIDPGVRELFTNNNQYFQSPYSEFIFYQMYARWVPEKGRRETWEEAVDRFMGFMNENLGDAYTQKEYSELREGILRQDICPSMRLLWSSGKACRESNVWAYNCSYIAPSTWQDLGEIMYILMCGAGLGFSVESESVQRFPQIKRQQGEKLTTHVVEDSKEGWADAYVLAMKTWADGKDVDFDYSQIRPAGARLKTAGGRASGPQPLVDLIEFSRQKMFSRQGRRLSNIDLHDIICKIGMIVVAGGVRRSALISLSDLDDQDLRDAKKGQFYMTEPQRSMANNSALYLNKPTAEEFLSEWTALVQSKSGERGIFNRGSLHKQLPERRWNALKGHDYIGVNPCGEIILRSKQFCNLTSIVVRSEDTLDMLKDKVRLATMLGTYQSTLTNFKYISKEWKNNCDEERLLGVSITGYYDNALVRDARVLDELRNVSIETNKKYAKKLGINTSTAITCIKPHGNSGQLLGVGSGMHPWFAPYYVRRVRISHTDPLFQFAKDQGIPYHPEVGQSMDTATTYVLEFPVKSPKGVLYKNDVSALDLLHEWKKIKEHFVEHNPSVTISVGDDEWVAVANFVYENWDIVGGLSFLPRTDHVYKLAPYEEISKEEYDARVKELGSLDFSKLIQYEMEDNTTGAREFACVAGVCETL